MDMSEGVTQAQFAREIGKSRQYVSKLVSAGKLPVLPTGKLDSAVCHEVLRRLRDPARDLAKRNDPPATWDDDLADDGEDRGSYNQVAIQHKRAQAHLAELELRKRSGELVDKVDVEREAFDAARITRDRIMCVPQEIAGELKAMAAGASEHEILVYLRNKLRDALMEAAVNVGEGG